MVYECCIVSTMVYVEVLYRFHCAGYRLLLPVPESPLPGMSCEFNPLHSESNLTPMHAHCVKYNGLI